MKKNKMKKGGKAVVSEEALLKSLNELEEAVLKGGDELLDQDPEGGLSTEGEPLSKKAPKGKADVAKADDGSSDDASDDEDDVNKGADMSDDESEEDDGSGDGDGDDMSDDESEEKPPMPMKKGKKGMSKSLRERADEGETTAKAIEVSDFIESMIDQASDAYADLQKAFSDEVASLEGRLEKSEAYQRNFNGRLAKGLVDIGKMLVDTNKLIKSLVNSPNPQMRKSILSADEIQEPSRGGGGGDETQLHPAKVAEWLFNKSMAGEIDSLLVTQYEVHRNIEALPVQVRKALVNDLRK